jgi:hypothetical protein
VSCNYFFYPILFVIFFKFVKYIVKCIEGIKKTTDIWNKLIKNRLDLKVKPNVLKAKLCYPYWIDSTKM